MQQALPCPRLHLTQNLRSLSDRDIAKTWRFHRTKTSTEPPFHLVLCTRGHLQGRLCLPHPQHVALTDMK